MEPTTFAELGLSAKVLAAITDAGYTIPTPIQLQAIPVAMTGRDVLGIAQTGTGKTAAFTMPMISRLEAGRARARMPRSLILAPTRELAAQVAQSFEKYGKFHKLAVALLIGGVSMGDQVAKLERGVDVLIATPGRLLDHFGRGRVMLMGVEILVIDEADRMLDMGFIPDIEKICKLLPPRRQTLFFSATMPPEITRLVDQFLNQPTRIEVAKPATTAATITQRFLYCPDSEDWAKRDALRKLIREQENVKNAIIFCNRKRDVAILLKSLLKHGFNAGALHGDMDQSSRTATLDKFRAGEITLLAASDVAARGLDIPDVSHVFNFDVPWQGDDYVHRIGRTGRAGREGTSATLVTLDDVKALKDIEKITGEAPVWIGEPPSDEDLADGATRKRRRAKPAGGHSDDKRRGSGRSRSDEGGERGETRARGRSTGRPPRDRAVADPRPLDPAIEAAGEPIMVDAGTGAGDSADGRERSRSRRRSAAPRPRLKREQAARATAQDHGQQSQPSGAVPLEVVGLGEQPLIDVAPVAVETAPMRAEGQPRRPRTADDRPARSGDRPRREPREPRELREAREPRQPQEARQARPTRESGDGRQHRRDDAGPRVGFEDNIPAFLRRPVR